MKILNKIKFAAITLLLLAGSATQALADNWVLGGMASSVVYALEWAYNLSYQTAAGDNTSWENKIITYETDGFQGIINPGATATPNTTCISIAYYYLDKTIPSYSKLDRTVSFTLNLGTTGNHHGCGLYLYDSEYTAKNTGMDPSYQQKYDNEYHGFNYAIMKFWGGDTFQTQSATRTWTHDNKSGSTELTKQKYVVLVHSIGCGGTPNTSKSWTNWKETVISESWTYYKYITFDANGGKGAAMGQQDIVNSGSLKDNTYTRTGFRFIGWNTQADGKGTAYTDGQAVTATLEDKGPVTLYAQWGIDVAVAETGTTVFFDKNMTVPAGLEVYGFTYSDGTLVQGAKITEGAVLPANSGYLVKASAGTYSFVTTTTDATVPTSVLTGTTADFTPPTGVDVYVWGKPEGYNYGWYKYIGATIPAGKAYYIKQQ